MRKFSVVLLSVMLFSGCSSTPTGNIEAFGNATKGVTDKIDGVIQQYNHENTYQELTKIAQHTDPITSSSLDPVGKVLIGEADKKRYALFKANRALGSYAEALTGLAKSGSRNEIDLAATKLYSSLHNFNEQYKTLSDTEENLIADETSAGIGKIVAAIGVGMRKKNEARQSRKL